MKVFSFKKSKTSKYTFNDVGVGYKKQSLNVTHGHVKEDIYSYSSLSESQLYLYFSFLFV